MSKKSAQLNIKVTPEQAAFIDRLAKHRITGPELIRGLLDSAADFYDKNGWFSFPVTIAPEHFQTANPFHGIDKSKLEREESGQKLPRAAQKEIADAQVTNRLSVEPPGFSPSADRIRAKQTARGAKKAGA